MLRVLVLLLVFALTTLPGVARAQAAPPLAGGTLTFSWDVCLFVTLDRTLGAGPTPLYAWVSNH